MKAGSLCTGYGGLDSAALAMFGGDLAWTADNDPNVAKIIAARYDVPNLGDITKVQWATVEKVELVCAGFPCQDLSTAGQRVGLMPGTRSGVWRWCAWAIAQLQPQIVIVENVSGIVSARAYSDLEPCRCLGEYDQRVPRLRALGAVLGDLASLGFDAEWETVSAAAAGGCHQRKRVFILAWRSGAAHPAIDGWNERVA